MLSTYQRGVSFDTFDNRDATDFSFTLKYKHKNYQASRRSRTFLCGTDQNDYSEFALEWLIDELVDDGDEVICLRVVEKDSKIASDASVDDGRYRKEAEKLINQVIAKNQHDEKAISLVLELAVGKVQEIIQRMVCLVTHIFSENDRDLQRSYRYIYMSRPFSLLGHEDAVLVACKACSLARYRNTAFNNPLSQLSSSVHLRSAKRRKRSALRTQPAAATGTYCRLANNKAVDYSTSK